MPDSNLAEADFDKTDNGTVFGMMGERTVRFSRDELVKTDCPVLNIWELKEKAAYKLPDSNDYLLVECEPRSPMRECPVCRNRRCLSKNGYAQYPRIVHDVNVGLMQVDLSVTVPKYLCTNCGMTISHEFKSIVPNRQFTNRLLEQIKVDSFHDTFSEVALKYGISDTTVADIFDEYAAELEENYKDTRRVGSWLALDEKHINHKMRGIFVDGNTGVLLEMTEDNLRETVKNTILGLNGYENITLVTTDMSNNYRPVIEEVFGSNVKVIVDKWHVLDDMAKKISACKTAVMAYLKERIDKEPDEARKNRELEVKKLVVDNGYLFKFGEGKLTGSRRQAMAEVCATFPEFNHLRLLKEGFERIYDCTNREEAESRFDEWCKLVPPSGKKQIEAWEAEYGVPAVLFEEMRALKNTASNRWRKEIFNYFDIDGFKTNAIAEATNSCIGRMQTYGYSFRRLRAKAVLCRVADSRKKYVLESRRQKRERYCLEFLTGSSFSMPHAATYEYFVEYGIYELDEKENHNWTVLGYIPVEVKLEFRRRKMLV